DVLPQGIEVGVDVSESFDLSRNNSSFLGHFNKVSTGEDHAGRKIKKALFKRLNNAFVPLTRFEPVTS
ncbi:MAG: hypothetical protein D6816_04440, partial [Bacteroidetes bacterium]